MKILLSTNLNTISSYNCWYCVKISWCFCICWASISSWERPDLDFNNSRLYSDTKEDYIGPAFGSWYPAYHNMFGQNILWYLLRVMRCDKISRLRISICTLPCNYTHLSIWYINVWDPYDWLKEVREGGFHVGKHEPTNGWKHWALGPPIPWGKAWAQHDAAPVELTRERGESIYAAAHHAARWFHPWSALLSRANLGHTTGTESAMLLHV